MRNNLKSMTERWNFFWEWKQDFYDGYDEISIVEYTELIEDTFGVIKKMRQYIDSKKYEDVEPNDMYWYIEMISIMARYGELPCTDDSENHIYTATALLATEVVNIAYLDNWNSELEKGIIEAIPGADYGVTKKIKYDISKKDISGYLEVANIMMK